MTTKRGCMSTRLLSTWPLERRRQRDAAHSSTNNQLSLLPLLIHSCNHA